MNKDLRGNVLRVARRVRAWTQLKANRAHYNPHNLCGWCAISAAYFFRELSKENIDAELHYVSGHCFVVVDDHVVDITASQFDEFENVEILILHIKEAEQHWFYQSSKVFSSPSRLRDHQLKERWPSREIAYTR